MSGLPLQHPVDLKSRTQTQKAISTIQPTGDHFKMPNMSSESCVTLTCLGELEVVSS